MGFFGLFKKGKLGSKRTTGWALAEKLNGMSIKYVVERIDDEDYVIGKSGALILKNDELLVFSSEDVVFRCKLDELEASELMSLGGVILSGPDIENEGRYRQVIAHYTYYIK